MVFYHKSMCAVKHSCDQWVCLNHTSLCVYVHVQICVGVITYMCVMYVYNPPRLRSMEAGMLLYGVGGLV